MIDTHIAKLMWDAYALQAGGKTFDGKPLPTWDELGEERQSCWIAAASVTADRIEKLEAALRWYEWSMCELGDGHGACGKLRDDECAGCRARKALEETK
jgi:hypothetical protein